jgi:hypothetical protein
LSPHIQDELPLAHDDIYNVSEPGFSDEIQPVFRFAPDFVEMDSLQKKIRQNVIAAVARDRKVSRLNAGKESRPIELYRGPYRLRPKANHPHAEVGLRFVRKEFVLLNEAAGEFPKTITIGIAMEDRPEHQAKPCYPLVEASVVPYWRLRLTM